MIGINSQPNSVTVSIQTEIYRAPEVILDAGYPYSADIWSLGVMLWDVLEDKKLFKEVDPLGVQEYDELNHLGHISALLGPPKELLDKGTRTDIFYNSDDGYTIVLRISASIRRLNSIGQFKGTTISPLNCRQSR
ncbi:hypothetical protein N7463_005851 [Penicillium fimorum]|uniref:Protein kinase domain-containing protein n=1 Tax=Penicillium fimorum TaxID=1882269 RepID=A0A9W9XTC0_9EURO|nr:hypothetical protein N7463_005851 [Penicillium fimorum]